MTDAVCPPPRLLLGTSLLFWGAMTDRPVLGLIAALLVEAKSWTKTRWDFDESSYESAWQLSFVLIAMAAVMIWLEESRYTAVLVLLTWLPLLLLPLQFVQSYGMKDSIRLGALSFLAKRSRMRNQRLGLKIDPIKFNFGNVFLVITLLASSVGMEELSYAFLPGLIILVGWALLATRRCRFGSLFPVMVLAGGLAVAGQQGLEHLENWLQMLSGKSSDQFNPHSNSTLIGSRGRVNQSSDIVWRLRTEDGSRPPSLLRTATYMNFIGDNWRNQPTAFSELNFRIIDDETYHVFGEGDREVEEMKQLSSFILRGGVKPKDPLPLPGMVTGMRGLDGDKVEQSVLGTVRILPTEPVIDMEVYWGGSQYPERRARPSDSLRMMPSERTMIRQVVQDMGLAEVEGLENKLNHLKAWFLTNFEYTQNLTIQKAAVIHRSNPEAPPSPLAQFLNDVRAGHCEYFATAATLMLREVGVHSRYAIGYAVMERSSDADEYVVRGTHAHAWVRVWDPISETWIDFDTTPPDWFGTLPATDSYMQQFKDWLTRIRQDFYLWRTQPENEWWVMAIISVIGLGLGAVVVFRLWRSRQDVGPDRSRSSYAGPVIRTPLHSIEKRARALLGSRPVGRTYAQWLEGLRLHLDDPGVLDEAISRHQCLRFDPQGMASQSMEELEELVRKIDHSLRQSSAN